MGAHTLSDDDCRAALDAYEKHGQNKVHAADSLGLNRKTYEHRLNAAMARKDKLKPVTLPTFPDDDLPVRELIEISKKRFQKREAHASARKWSPIKVNIPGPIGLSFFGDPHVDNNGCNWPLLDHHCDLHRKTEGLFAVNIGDTTDNWMGRLLRLAAKSDTSQGTARKLAKWLLLESGVTWLANLIGNHDDWNDGAAVLEAMAGHKVPMHDWQAQFKLVFPKGRECKVWAAHNFAGHSMWNTLHGPQKAAHTKSEADIYAAGHTHNWAVHQEESASREFVYWLIRSRGYKFIDDHAEKLGHAGQQEGAAITAIIDPEAKSMAGFVQCYADMDEAVDYLKHKRRKARV